MTAAAVGRRRSRFSRDGLETLIADHRSISILIGMALVGVLLYFLPYVPPLSLFNFHQAWLNSFASAGVFVLLALGLNVVVGMAGLLDLGYAAFFAFGAYAYAYGASPFSGNHVPFLVMLFIGAWVAAIFGILLGAPTLRLRGDYLAIMTLGFGEIVPIVFLNAETYTRGTNGILGIYRPDLPVLGVFGALDNFKYFVLMLFILAITMVLLYRLQDSRIGRAWMAIREDELAAAANGINTVTTKLLAFAIGATTAGFAGVFNASKLTIVSPDQFLFAVSFTVLAMVVLGGMGNIWGVAVGAFVIAIIQSTLLTQFNTFIQTFRDVPILGILASINFLQFQFLLYGIALVLMMLFRPEGLFPSRRRRMELRVAEELDPETEAKALEAAAAAAAAAMPATEEVRTGGGDPTDPAQLGAMGAPPGSDEDTASTEETGR
jgi:ABC-type branched-subunit amino acid transport system permease subunit